MVYQERNLVGMLTGAQNICLGTEPLENALIDENQIEAEARRLKEQMGLSVPLDEMCIRDRCLPGGTMMRPACTSK